MQIKACGQQSGLSPKTIRYYEEIGLLPAPRRLANGYRVYDSTDVARARLVFHTCASCGVRFNPLPGDCCVFCSFGDDHCVSKQREALAAA